MLIVDDHIPGSPDQGAADMRTDERTDMTGGITLLMGGLVAIVSVLTQSGTLAVVATIIAIVGLVVFYRRALGLQNAAPAGDKDHHVEGGHVAIEVARAHYSARRSRR